MISFITGVPRSGKSYKAMYILFANFAKDKDIVKDKKFKFHNLKNALTNINEIDLTKFNNVSPMDWDSFYDSLTLLYTMYKNKVTDTLLKEKANELNILGTLVILDECHNFLDNQDKIIIWWLTYHGHLHQEVILITQNLGLVHTRYKGIAEFFYKAIPTSLKIFNQMKYIQFIGSRMSANLKSGVVKIPIINEVFESYGSGKNQKSKSLILKFTLFAISFFIFAITLLYVIRVFISGDTPSNNKAPTQTYVKNKDIKEDKEYIEETELSELHYMKLICSTKYDYCMYNNQKINLSFYMEMKKILKIREISLTKINKNFSQLEIFANDDFYYVFHKGVENEKNNSYGSNGYKSIFK